MSGSDYYYQSALSYQHSKEEEEKKKSDYEKAIKNIEKIRDNIVSIGNYLVNCNNNLLGGGYIKDGVSIDNGDLETMITTVSTEYETINQIITDSNNELSEIEANIESYKSLYETAMSNYYAALARENS